MGQAQAVLLGLLAMLAGCAAPPPSPSPGPGPAPGPSPSPGPQPAELRFTVPAVLPPATTGVAYAFAFCGGAATVPDRTAPCGSGSSPATNPTGGQPPYVFGLQYDRGCTPPYWYPQACDPAHVGTSRYVTPSGVPGVDVRFAGTIPPLGPNPLSVGGVLSGTPEASWSPDSAAGLYRFAVCASDASDPPQTVCQNVTLPVLSANVTTAGDGEVSASLQWSCSAVGSVTAYAFRTQEASNASYPAGTCTQHAARSPSGVNGTVAAVLAAGSTTTGGGASASARATLYGLTWNATLEARGECGPQPQRLGDVAPKDSMGVYYGVRPAHSVYLTLWNHGATNRVVVVNITATVARGPSAAESTADGHVATGVPEGAGLWSFDPAANSSSPVGAFVDVGADGLAPGQSLAANATWRFVLEPGKWVTPLEVASADVFNEPMTHAACPSVDLLDLRVALTVGV